MQHIALPEDYSLVLQEVSENGEEDLMELSETLNLDGGRLQHIITALQHKGLVTMTRSASRGAWVSLTAKGQKLMQAVWPDSARTGLSYGY